jgi:kumamolisin
MLLAAAAWAWLPGLACAAAPVVRLDGSVVKLRPEVQVIGKPDPASVLHFHLALRPRNMDDLAARVTHGGRSTPAELRARFFPAQKDYDTVVAWARSVGLTVDRTTPTHLMVEVSGTAPVISQALDVDLEHVRAEGADYVTAVSAPAIPAALEPILLGVNGLQPHLHYHSNMVRAVHGQAASGFTPAGIKQAYSASKLAETGSGVTTAIIIDTFPNTSDLTAYWKLTNIDQSLSNITFISASLGTLPAPSGEESLDTELSSSIAPASLVRVYATASLTSANVDNGYEAIVLDLTEGVKIDQVSISLGQCEADVSEEQALTDLYYHEIVTALGASIFIASGDSGSMECGSGNGNVPSFASTSPFVTAVGGTTLKLSEAGVATETAWSGSGGGLSVLFTKPNYQSKIKISERGVPDVAAVANPATGVIIVLNGSSEVVGGTSAATPIWAGLMALVNQARLSAGKTTLGLLNPDLYPLLGTANFRDIKSGSNGGYSAKAGYDLVTGIGAPLMSKLLPTLVAD